MSSGHPRSGSGTTPLLQVPVADEEGEEAGKTRGRYNDDKGIVEGGDVGVDDGFLEFFWKREDDGDGLADGLEHLGGDHAGVLGEVRSEPGAEDGA